MAYLDATINHLRAVHEWAHDNGVEVRLDLLNFELEIKGRNRYFILYPQFISELNGQRAHTTLLTKSVVGFIGWLPYRPLRWPLSNDKKLFKSRVRQLGLSTPAMWETATEAKSDFLLKTAVGSFGYQIAGPYRHQAVPAGAGEDFVEKHGNAGGIYAEQFIEGRNIKAWFWGAQVFHLELDEYPDIVGNGQKTVAELLQERLSRLSSGIAQYAEMEMVIQSLNYQGLCLTSWLQAGQSAWIDFRYGRRFLPERNNIDTNQLGNLDTSLRSQIVHAGHLLSDDLQRDWNAPVLYSLDGVVDSNGQVWWLEMNSNPVFPPTGYRAMLATLFGTPVMPQDRNAGRMQTVAVGPALPDVAQSLASTVQEGA